MKISYLIALTFLLACSSKPKSEALPPVIVPEKVVPDVAAVYEELKQYTKNGISSEHRELAWRRLFEAKTLEQKLFHAADYIDSFDFQAWNVGFADALIQENAPLKDYVIAHDIYELSLSLTELLSKVHPKSSEDVYTNDRSLLVFYAIAASLSDVAPANGTEAAHSFYNFIQQGLQHEKDINAGSFSHEQLSRSDNEVIKNSVLFKDTLYARFQYLSYIALEYHTKNPAMAIEAINFALSTRDFLRSLNVDAKLHKKLRIDLKHIKPQDAEFRQKVLALLAEDTAKS